MNFINCASHSLVRNELQPIVTENLKTRSEKKKLKKLAGDEEVLFEANPRIVTTILILENFIAGHGDFVEFPLMGRFITKKNLSWYLESQPEASQKWYQIEMDTELLE